MKARAHKALAALLPPLALAGLALALRWHGLGDLTFIDDELAHIHSDELLARIGVRTYLISPLLPLWLTLFQLWVKLCATDLGVRLFSLAWGVLAVPCLYGAGLLAGGRPLGLLAGLLLAVNGFAINFSQTSTPYAFMLFLGAASLLCLLALLRGPGRPAALAHGLVLVCAIYTHQAGLLLWGAELCGLLLLALRGPRPWLGRVLWTHGAALAAGAGVAPFLLAQWANLRQVGVPYVEPATLAVLRGLLHDLWAYHAPAGWTAPLELVFVWAGLAAGGAAVAGVLQGRDLAEGHRPLALALPVAVLPVALCLAAGVLLAKEMAYAPRFFAMFVPAGVLLLAGAVARAWRAVRLGPARRALAGLLLAAYLGPQAGSLAFLYGPARSAENFPVHDVNAFLAQHSRPGDAAVVHYSYNIFFFKHYYRHPWPRFLGAVHEPFQDRPFGGLFDRAVPGHGERLLARLEPSRRVWLILTPSTNRSWRDPDGVIKAALDRTYTPSLHRCFACDTGDPIEVTLYGR